ncbi:MAG: ABC transporter permease subunit [Ferruginibacter sp.]
MYNLLKIEWMKVKSYRAFIVLSSFFVIGVFLANYISFLVNKNIINKVNTAGLVSSFSPYNFSHTWQTTSYVTGFLLILPALLIIILVTNEYTYRTVRQNIIDGWSRAEFINVKLLIAFLVTIISTLLVFLTAFGFGLASGSDFSMDGFSHVGFFFMKSLSYNLIAVLISVLIKRTGFAIGLYFIYLGTENIISQLLDVWSLKLRRDNNIDLGSMGDYLPMNASDGLLTFPDNPLKQIAKSNLPTDYFYVVVSLAVIYILLFIFFSRQKFLNADL